MTPCFMLHQDNILQQTCHVSQISSEMTVRKRMAWLGQDASRGLHVFSASVI